MATKKAVAIEGLIYCSQGIDSGFVLGGKILDISKKPSYVVLNRGYQSETVVGPNKIIYDEQSGDMRVQIPDNYLSGQSISQVFID